MTAQTSTRPGETPLPEEPARADGLWSPQRRALTVGLVLTITFIASEALAVVTIMPLVARDLHGLGLYGWVFSAFMLGNILGIVAAGRQADRHGPARPFLAGLVLFGAGLTIAGWRRAWPCWSPAARCRASGQARCPRWPTSPSAVACPIGCGPRMMAVLSTAWVVPGLVGPAISAAVASLVGWRWVFLGLLPLVAITGSLAMPALFRLGRQPRAESAAKASDEHKLSDGVAVAAGAAMILAGLTMVAGSGPVPLGAGLLLAGLAAIARSLRRLLPPGTFTARPGLPAVILCRGLLTFGFFGADAYVTLTIATVRHHTPALAGLAVTGATLSWTAGAWLQSRLNTRWTARQFVSRGVLIIAAGLAAMALVLLPAVPIAVGVAAWTVAGFGIGLSYAPISLAMLRAAPPGREGWASASLSLADVLGTALGIGAGGAAIAAASAHGWPLARGVGVAFAIAAAGLVGLAVASRRLPRTVAVANPDV